MGRDADRDMETPTSGTAGIGAQFVSFYLPSTAIYGHGSRRVRCFFRLPTSSSRRHALAKAGARTHAPCPLDCTKSGLPDLVIKEAAEIG